MVIPLLAQKIWESTRLMGKDYCCFLHTGIILTFNKNTKPLYSQQFFFLSHLYIARGNNPAIVRYNPSDGTSMNLVTEGSAQSISVDVYNNVIYWANFNGSSHNVMRTQLTGETKPLGITYPGRIEITSDLYHFYVLDKYNDRIDKYLKSSLEKLGSVSHSSAIEDLVIGFGKLNIHGSD